MPNVAQGHFEPIHDAHAIEQVLFAVQFDRPLGDETLPQIRSISDSFAGQLPGIAELRGVRVAVGQGVISSGPAEQSLGVARSRVAPNGTIECELRVERASITFRTTKYTRWSSVWETAKTYFDALVPAYIEAGAMISALGLSFVDKFIWAGEVSRCDPKLILKPSSIYLCPNAYASQDLWHCHSGYFSRHDAVTKRLLNANVDYVEEVGPRGVRRGIVVATVLTDIFNQPGFQPFHMDAKAAPEIICEHMRNMHTADKSILAEIIDDEMAKRIALGD